MAHIHINEHRSYTNINVTFYWARSDDTVHYKCEETVNFFAVLDVQLYVAYNRFYKLRFFHINIQHKQCSKEYFIVYASTLFRLCGQNHQKTIDTQCSHIAVYYFVPPCILYHRSRIRYLSKKNSRISNFNEFSEIKKIRKKFVQKFVKCPSGRGLPVE